MVRGGIGVYYENSVFNNVLFDRPFKLAEGRFNATATLCSGYGVYSFTLPGTNTVVDSYNGKSIEDICNNETIDQSGPAFAALQQLYQQATTHAPTAANGDFVGNTLSIPTAVGYAGYAPNFKTAYATQINIGLQREFWRGSVLSVDYLHSVTNHIMQAIDTNHIGDARYFDKNAAAAAIQATLSTNGWANIDDAINNGATIADFASNGLDSSIQENSGYPQPGFFAFSGINPLVGQGWFQFPSGRNGYDALQVNYRQQAQHPLPGVANSNFEASWSFSRQVNTIYGVVGGSDSFFTPAAWDYNQPTRFIGPGDLDRTHIFSFGGSALLKFGMRVGLIGHFYTSPASNLVMDTTTTGSSGQIFQSDYTGDGSIGDPFPGTNPGAMMRQVNNHNISNLINRYNTQEANTLTPAGQTVVHSGLITAQQMQRLGGVMQPVGLVTGQGQTLRNYPFRTLAANFAYPIKLRWLGEGTTLEPGVAMYNFANFGNYSLNNYDPELLNNPGDSDFNYPNAPMPYAAKDANRITRGAGTFDSGDARSTEFSLKLTF